MNVLFLTFNDINNPTNGGNQCGERNYLSLKKKNRMYLKRIDRISTIKSAWSILEGHMPPFLNHDLGQISSIIQKDNIEVVFLDRSLLGTAARYIKRNFPDVQIISFFHNIESDYMRAIINHGLKQDIYYKIAYRQERFTIKFSDKIISLTNRDSEKIKALYGRNADAIIPITFEDRFSGSDLISCNSADPYNHHPAALMVGGLRNDTRENIKWLKEKIAERTPDTYYYLVGRGLEREKISFERKNVKVVGSVDDLLPYYFYADFVVLPIIAGAGMKVKTAEALMYGKTIVGTDEALIGYEIDDERVGKRCNTPGEFYDAINKLSEIKHFRINEYARNLFKEKYSNSISDVMFDQILKRG